MLVQDDFASEKLAEENKGSIFQKADSMAGDRHIGYIGTMNQQLPKDAQKEEINRIPFLNSRAEENLFTSSFLLEVDRLT